MKNNFKALFKVIPISLLSLCAVLFLQLPALQSKAEDLPLPDPKIAVTMDFQDVSLKDILKVFSMQSGLNFIASEAVQERKVTLYFDKVPIKEALDSLFRANNLYYEMDKDTNIFIVKELGRGGVETVTKVFFLKYATVSTSLLRKNGSNTTGGGDTGILGVITKLLSEHGSAVEDSRTNSIIVTDIPAVISDVSETILALDTPQPQIMLEVEMLDVSKNTVDKIGLKFGSSDSANILSMVVTGAKRTTNFPLKDFSHTLSTVTEGSVNFGSTTYTVLLNFIRTQSDTRYLARPRILTLNNETAEIKIVTQETVASTTVTQGQGTASTTTTAPERIETGVILEVTPQINLQTKEITLFLNPKVKDTSTSTLTGITAKDPEERSAKTLVRVSDGDTIIIGGLIRNEKSETITKLPILGDIPLLGWLFRHKNTDKDRERELLIFITPRIVRDRNTALAFASQERKPEGKERILEESLRKAYKKEQEKITSPIIVNKIAEPPVQLQVKPQEITPVTISGELAQPNLPPLQSREGDIASELDAVEKDISLDISSLLADDMALRVEREVAINSAFNKAPVAADNGTK